jgi:hypothetical protein
MDLGVAEGTEVLAAFAGEVHFKGFVPHDKSKDDDKHYGTQLIIKSDNGLLLGFYTHFTDSSFPPRRKFARGDRLGKTMRDHLHLALAVVEGEREKGVDLYKHFVALRDSATVIAVTFKQDGSPPDVTNK